MSISPTLEERLPRRYLVSGSMLPIVSRCSPSGVLPRVHHDNPKGDAGSAMHEHVLVDRVAYGIDGAVARIPALAKKHGLDEREAGFLKWRCKTFEWTPPRGAITELALGLCEDGSVIRVKGGKGDYPDLPHEVILPTQIDAIWAEPDPLVLTLDESGKVVRVTCPETSTLWVVDLKCGKDQYVEDVEHNAQIVGELVCAARWTGAKRAMPVILYAQPGKGSWDVPEAALDEDGIARAEAFLRGWLASKDAAGADYEAGRPLTYSVGPWCTYCASEIYCSAKTANLKAFLNDPAPLATTVLTEEQARKIAELLPQLPRFEAQAKRALKAYVMARGEPIALDNGKVWGPHPEEKSVIDPVFALEALNEELGGSPHVQDAVAIKATRESIEEAIRQDHADKGITRKLAPAVARVMATIKARGGITKRPETWWSMFTPADTTSPSAPEKMLRLGEEARDDIPIDGDD